MPSAPPVATIPSTRDEARLERARPQIELWHQKKDKPQKSARRHPHRHERLLIAGTEPVMVVLRFHPRMAGESLIVIPGPGVKIDPPHEIMQISQTGEGSFQVELDPVVTRSHIVFESGGVKTTLPLLRAPKWALEKEEKRSQQP